MQLRCRCKGIGGFHHWIVKGQRPEQLLRFILTLLSQLHFLLRGIPYGPSMDELHEKDGLAWWQRGCHEWNRTKYNTLVKPQY